MLFLHVVTVVTTTFSQPTTHGEEHIHSWPQDDVLLITLLNFGFVSPTKIAVSLAYKLGRAVRKNDTSNRDVLLPV